MSNDEKLCEIDGFEEHCMGTASQTIYEQLSAWQRNFRKEVFSSNSNLQKSKGFMYLNIKHTIPTIFSCHPGLEVQLSGS